MNSKLKYFIYGMVYTSLCGFISIKSAEKIGTVTIDRDPKVISDKLCTYFSKYSAKAERKMDAKNARHLSVVDGVS